MPYWIKDYVTVDLDMRHPRKINQGMLINVTFISYENKVITEKPQKTRDQNCEWFAPFMPCSEGWGIDVDSF